MSDNNKSSSSSGIGFFGLLTIVFITLKVLGKITWSWWLVLSPMFIWLGITLTILLGVFLVLVAAAIFGSKK